MLGESSDILKKINDVIEKHNKEKGKDRHVAYILSAHERAQRFPDSMKRKGNTVSTVA